jgi:hypothetical protein
MIISKNISASLKVIMPIIACETLGILSGLISKADMNKLFLTNNKP